jgi:hypothetical protein
VTRELDWPSGAQFLGNQRVESRMKNATVLAVVSCVILLWVNVASAIQEHAVQAEQATVSPGVVPSLLPQPEVAAPPSATQLDVLMNTINRRIPIPSAPGGLRPAVPLLLETPPPALPLQSPRVLPALPSDLTTQRVSSLGAAAVSKSTVGEATASGFGTFVFQSGNWYLDVSGNAGATWSPMDPQSLMAGIDGGFCCDQVVRYDVSRDLVLVAVLSIPSAVTQKNTVRLLVISGLRAAHVGFSSGPQFFIYDFTPQMLGLPAGQWHDYPKMTVGKNNVYLTTNRFAPAGCSGAACIFQGSTIQRFPLDPLKTGAGFTFNFLNSSAASPLVAEGIANSDTAYWGSNLTTSSTRLFRWAEDSGTIFFSDFAVTAWSDAARTCAGPDGRDFAGRADGRLAVAVLSDRWDGTDGKQLLFGQSSAAQAASSRPFAYVRMTRVAVGTLTPIDTVDLAFSNACVLYASGAPNSQNGVGVSSFLGGGVFNPTHQVCVKDEFGGTGTFPFQCMSIRSSDAGPTTNAWGDYTYVDQLYPNTCAFQTAGWVITSGSVDPFFVSFGRSKCFP